MVAAAVALVSENAAVGAPGFAVALPDVVGLDVAQLVAIALPSVGAGKALCVFAPLRLVAAAVVPVVENEVEAFASPDSPGLVPSVVVHANAIFVDGIDDVGLSLWLAFHVCSICASWHMRTEWKLSAILGEGATSWTIPTMAELLRAAAAVVWGARNARTVPGQLCLR